MTATEKSNKLFWIDQDFRNQIYECLGALTYTQPRVAKKLQTSLDNHTLLRDWCEDASSYLHSACFLAADQIKEKDFKTAKKLVESTAKHKIEIDNPNQKARSEEVENFSSLYLK